MAAEISSSRLTNPAAEFVGGLKLAEDSGVIFDVAQNKMRFQEDAIADENDRYKIFLLVLCREFL
jgi:hypothetical protein